MWHVYSYAREQKINYIKRKYKKEKHTYTQNYNFVFLEVEMCKIALASSTKQAAGYLATP